MGECTDNKECGVCCCECDKRDGCIEVKCYEKDTNLDYKKCSYFAE